MFLSLLLIGLFIGAGMLVIIGSLPAHPRRTGHYPPPPGGPAQGGVRDYRSSGREGNVIAFVPRRAA